MFTPANRTTKPGTVSRKQRPKTLADLVARLGNIPLHRIAFWPPPGTATVKDVIVALEAADKRLYELVDGVLVEKDMGARESYLGGRIGHGINNYLDTFDLGFVLGPDGALRILPRLVRIPDVSFISWGRLAERVIPDRPIPDLVPDLAVEVISKGNTPGEMARKLKDYFEAGVRLVWFIYPRTRTAEIYTSPTECRRIGKAGSLTGGDVLPGFKLSLKKLFSRTGP